MTINEARQAIYKRFQDEWGTTTPVAWPNVEFRVEDLADGDPWVEFRVLHSGARQMSMGNVGNRRFTASGTIMVRIFVPVGTNMATADELSQKVLTILEARRITDTLVTQAGVAREGAPSGKFLTVVVVLPFTYDDVR